jgi:hypothetical protein
MTGQSETNEFSPILLLKSAGRNLKWPIFETSDNKTSLVCFTDKRKAEEFVEALGMHGYELGTMELVEFGRWLRQNLRDGVNSISLDPDPSGGRQMDIFHFLAETGF